MSNDSNVVDMKRGGDSSRANVRERVAWFNGELLPESQVRVSFRDRGFKFGDAVFDMARTFGGRPFKLCEHVERLYKSLAYVRIDPGISLDEMLTVSARVIEANMPLLPEGNDYWVGQRVSRGVDTPAGETPIQAGPTVIVECTPLPLAARAKNFRDGIDVVVPSVRRTPPEVLSPRAKSHNYLNMIIGDLEVRAHRPDAWAVLCDTNGNLAEGLGSNIFLVIDGAIHTPREDFVLPGVSRATAIELARELGIPVHERDCSLYDASVAEEAFLTSTSLCICPVHTVNGAPMRDRGVPGPVTRRLMDAYKALVEFDYVAQYLRHA
ncbi:MAG: aminotransferase class IV [Ectothiorhodospiraceae bacterium]|nr:aminotransferase class IV [Chromatiales bacterium]MCP5154480.1 aminotransferase class IV [Ectothiorhodospiraceae bacterium]